MDEDPWGIVFSITFIAGLVIFFSWDSDNWIGRYRHAFSHDVEYRDVNMAMKPHDCEFLTAPVGSKHCSYKPVVTPDGRGKRRGVIVTWVKVRD